MMRRVLVALALFTLLMPGLAVFNGCSPEDSQTDTNPRAVVIDQLSPSKPDPDFITRATAILENNGLKVDYFSGEEVTLELYRRLPIQGYSLIVFRAHSGLLSTGQDGERKTCLFTNQPYSQTAEWTDQLFGRVVKAAVDSDPPLFGIDADFVNGSMRGQFKDTTVIMMGCSSLEKDDLAQAFINRGAAAYCGWNAEVKLKYDDYFTLRLLDRIYELKSVAAAAQKTMQEKGPDPDTGAELNYLTAASLAKYY